ncbi:OsmC family protein [Acidovorax sp. SUPP950]|uniref:OsmC family protein n=1 Tax=unclassified Acidovorax TaxID=2684926 RepID=UPI0023491EB6|nr:MULTISPECIES: OsmC family protein [Comamonadaceae]WCM97930.1 OsmC family protein [Acidovorax sp. GBBC 1281]WOI47900.1 OsmC family protein [Paracidovorax avenae]GKS76409.1 OsmC family protein [Acidovorax sp. SUPP950]GKS83081.1 OsmC family protein [Acidovorax sp. SUPP1855]GKS89442.1 OsmC family protein [Acidovorax sp. SUPP2539]
MAEHLASITWQRGSDAFLDRRYHRAHQWQFDGGATVAASSSPHVVPLPYSDAAAVDPEEAFVAALSSCHMLWFLDLACRDGWRVDHYRDDAVGTMAPDDQGRPVVAHVQLRPVTRFDPAHAPSQEALEALHHRAHAACFLANSVRTRIDCAPVLETADAA